MGDFVHQDLRGARFEDVDLTGAEFVNVDLSNARLNGIDLTGARFRGVDLVDVEISGSIEGLRINDIEIFALVETELDRRYPERVKLRPTDAEGFREAWAVIEGLWPATVERAKALPPERLHVRVDGEWSFIETMRHLLFATDAWVKRAILGDPEPYAAVDLPHTEMADEPGVPRDPDARPSLDEVLKLRADRMAIVRGVMDELTDESLHADGPPLPAPGYPPANTYVVSRGLGAVVNEEWWHRHYAERDLAVLEGMGE